MIKTSLKGAIIGSAVGASVGVLYSVSTKFLTPNDTKFKEYPFLEEDGELKYLVDEITSCIRVQGVDYPEEAVGVLHKSLNKLMALNVLVEQSKPADTKPGWTVNAHHHVEEVVDSLRVIRKEIENNKTALVQFETHAAELQTFLNNILYNISMQLSANLSA